MPILGTIASSRLTTVPDGAELISTQSVNGVGTVTFSSLNTYTQYDHLEIHWNLNSTAGLYLRMRFNSDSATNYVAKNTIANYTSGGVATVAAGDYPGGNTSGNRTDNAPLPRVADASPGVAVGYCLIPMFSQSVWHSYLAMGGGGRYVGTTSAGAYNETFGGQWNQATAITSVQIYMNSNTWGTGSTMSLYGWRNT